MANQYSRLTADNIRRKANRRRNPVRSLAQLADEFGVRTDYTRWDGSVGRSAPPTFRSKVKELVGEDMYKQIRDNDRVNAAYR